NFVDIVLAHELADLEPARVVLLGPLHAADGLGIELHAADLPDLERTAAAAGADLRIEDRAGRFLVDQEAEDGDERSREHEANERADNIDGLLEETVVEVIE